MKSLLIAIFAIFASLLFALPSFANDVTDIRLSGGEEKTRLVIELQKQVAFKVYNIGNPDRIIVDFDAVNFKLKQSALSHQYGLVKEYRYGNFSLNKSRLVLDTTKKTSIAAAFIVPRANGAGALLVVDMVPKAVAAEKPTVNQTPKTSLPKKNVADSNLKADPKVSQLEFQPDIPSIDDLIDFQPDIPSIDELIASQTEVSEPETTEIASTNIKQEKVDLNALIDAPKPVAAPKDIVSVPSNMRISLAPKPVKRPSNYRTIVASIQKRQAAAPSAQPTDIRASLPVNRKPIIVLDAGHGGIDGGTVSLRGTKEKDVVLAMAKRLQRKLLATGKYKVYLTRKGDYFIKLRDRVKISRKHKADLFISLHADSVPGRNSSARGASIYTLSDKASDKEAAALARKENRSDIVAGVQFENESKEVASILIDLAQRDTKTKSVSFANATAKSMKNRVRVRKKPLKFGNLRVLKAPDVPSVLIELGYLSNRYDEQNLKSSRWQDKMATAIQLSVANYFKNRPLF